VVLQRASGFAPVTAGTALLPVTVVMLLLSARMGRLATRIGPRLPMTIGPLLAGGGLVLLVRVGAHASYIDDLLPGVLVFALGLSMTVAPLTATALSSAPAHQVGVASAINNDIARTAGLLAVAVLPGLAGITPAAYRHPDQLASGFHHALWIAAGLCAIGGLLSALFVSGRATAARAPDPRAEDVAALQPHCPVQAPHARPGHCGPPNEAAAPERAA
jgi:MFS family permease